MTETHFNLTTTDVARQLHVSVASVHRWTNAGYLRCITTPGGHRRYSQADVNDFMSARTSSDGAA